MSRAEIGDRFYDRELFDLGKEADDIRSRLYGKKTFFNVNRHINPTNICADVCKFCAYSATRKNPNQYTLGVDEILQIVENSTKNGVKELHIVGAHNPVLDIDWYSNLFIEIKKAFPAVHIKALTAAEVNFFAKNKQSSFEYILERMAESGVDSMPGGGAEIFDEEIRAQICKGKVSSQDWLKIHEAWHKMGKKSNATMLFGHIESRASRIDHILRIRELQERSGGFNAFIPLVYQKENNYLNVKNFLSGQEILKTIAISRILLENIPHIKAYWVTSSINLALVAQEFGADDLDGTIERESINSAAGAKSFNGMKIDEFISLIKNSGFTPIERDSLYNELKSY